MKNIAKVLTLLIILLTYTNHVDATNESKFTVNPIYDKTVQDGNINNYFKYNLEEAYKGDIRFAIKNNTARELTILVKTFNSYVSENGVLDYKSRNSAEGFLLDDRYKLSEYTGEDFEVILNPKEVKEVSVSIDSSKVEGNILGGIAFEDMTPKEESSGEQFKVKVEENLIYAVQLSYKGSPKADITYEEPYIKSLPSAYLIKLPVNVNGSIVRPSSKIAYKVTDKNGNVIIDTTYSNTSKVDIAPKVNFNLNLPWTSEKIKRAKYMLEGFIEVRENKELIKYPFKYELDFENQGRSEMISNITTELVEGKPLLLIALIFLLLLPLLLFLLARRRNLYALLSNDEESQLTIKEDEPLKDYLIKLSKVSKEDKEYYDICHIYRYRRKDKWYIYKRSVKLK